MQPKQSVHSNGCAGRLARLGGSTVIAMLIVAGHVSAQSADQADIAGLREELLALKASQAQAQEKIAKIEAAIKTMDGKAVERVGFETVPQNLIVPAADAPASKLTFSGDMRLRYEANLENDDLPFRGREAVRARLRAGYAFSDQASVGAELTTGDSDDPNTADVTLSNFDDDLEVSLDQLYARYAWGDWLITGGKFPNPFDKTDLVWDGDVNPQGVNVGFRHVVSDDSSIGFNAIYFIIDESAAGSESDMVGIQGKWTSSLGADWKASAALGYYDYTLSNLAGADAGDRRSNLIAADGSYVSDFNLLDAVASLTFSGQGPRWPVRIIGDYVRNLGAETSEDTGYGVDFLIGRAEQPADYRFGYGYAEAETDAVLAAFSHDNLNLATNYRQHTLLFDYALTSHMLFNTTYYHYKPLSDAAPGISRDWQDRVRFNLTYNF
jgi:hypothetical protein